MGRRALVVGTVVTFAFAGRADECRTTAQVLAGFVSPADGANDVPQNTAPLVESGSFLGPLLFGNDDTNIPVKSTVLVVGSAGDALELFRVVPEDALPAGCCTTMTVDNIERTRFSVGASRDDTRPAAPTAAISSACTTEAGAVAVAVAGADDATLVISSFDGAPTFDTAGPRLAAATTPHDPLVVVGRGSEVLHIASVNAAGNAGASFDLDVDFPLCACTSTAKPPPFAALALLVALFVPRIGTPAARRGPR